MGPKYRYAVYRYVYSEDDLVWEWRRVMSSILLFDAVLSYNEQVRDKQSNPNDATVIRLLKLKMNYLPDRGQVVQEQEILKSYGIE